MKLRTRRVARAVVATVMLGAGVAVPTASAAGVGYNSVPSPLPGNLASLGFEATQTGQVGNEITLAGPGPIGHVTVTLSSWACQSGSGNAGPGQPNSCVTKPGATFAEPITLNLYQAPTDGNHTPGALISSVTQTFSIPYRPSASSQCNTSDDGGWYDGAQGCYHGLAYNVTFTLNPHPQALPATLVYDVSYNTSGYGPQPYGYANPCNTAGPAGGDGCPYDSLNVALSQDPTNVKVGSDPNPGTAWWDTQTASNYCDDGADGVGFFREDSPEPGDNCWSANSTSPPWMAPYYVPSVQLSP